MELTLTKTRKYSLKPYGKFIIKFDKPKVDKPSYILLMELTIKHETGMPMSQEQEKEVVKLMKKNKTDILTDGQKFYTRIGDDLTEVYHVRLYNYKSDETYRSIVDEMYKLFN